MRILPCCMCPATPSDFKEDVCNEQTVFLGKKVGCCDFVNVFTDERGWFFFVKAGKSGNTYRTFFRKPGMNPHAYRNLPWRTTFHEAQEDLNQLAIKKGWQRQKI